MSKREQARAAREQHCMQCGADISHLGGRWRLCPEPAPCRTIRRNETATARYQAYLERKSSNKPDPKETAAWRPTLMARELIGW